MCVGLFGMLYYGFSVITRVIAQVIEFSYHKSNIFVYLKGSVQFLCLSIPHLFHLQTMF